MLEASERPHQVAELADEPENLSLIPRMHLMERARPCKLSSDLNSYYTMDNPQNKQLQSFLNSR